MTRRDAGAAAPHLDDDVGLDLVHGLLLPDLEAEWIGHLRTCPSCEVRLRRLAETHERGRSRYAGMDTSGADAGGLRLVTASGAPSRSRRIAWWSVGLGVAAAAALLVLFGPMRASRPGRPADLATHPWLPVGHSEVRLRSEGAALTESLRLGLAAYDRHDLASARRILESARLEGGADLLRRLYLADVLLRQGEPALVTATLEPLELSGLPDPWRSRGYRVLILALDATGQRDRANALCTRLAGDPGEIGDFVRSRDRSPPRR